MQKRSSVTTLIITSLAAFWAGFSAPPVAAQGPPPAVREAIRSLVTTLQAGDEPSARAFVAERLTDTYRARLGAGAVPHVRALQETTRRAHGNMGVDRMDDGSLRLSLSGEERVAISITLDETSGRFSRIELLADDAGGGDRRTSVDDHMMALEQLGMTDDAIAVFIDERLSPDLRARADEMAVTLREVARAAASAGGVMLDGDGAYEVLRLQGGGTMTTVRVLVGEDEPYLIEELDVERSSAGAGAEPASPIPWAELHQVLGEAESDWGFSGTVLAVREGEVVLHESYGLANRDSGRAVDNETVFDIGSQPIDFTRAAIWLLVQRGELAMSDPITRFYPDAPADKRSMTIEHLMSETSGLPNFHHVSSDADWDLSWIDRETAEQRILGQPLLFEPGTERSMSHSGFGLLAAIVEHASGQSYEDFLRSEFFAPLGITRTGPYGDDLGLPLDDFAVGYGGYGVGDPNIPPNWGPTSWLIKGSGGMVSTPSDLYTFLKAMKDGEILTGAARDGYLERGSSSGATDRGFLFSHAWAGGSSGSMILFSQNVDPDREEARELRRRLAATVGVAASGG